MGRAASNTATPLTVVIVTMDTHLASAVARSRTALTRDIPGLRLVLFAASEWTARPEVLERCTEAIARADIVIATMLFLEEHFLPILPALEARRADARAMVCAMSAPEVVRLTRMGRFDMGKPTSGPLALLRRLRGKSGSSAGGGAAQMRVLRQLPRILRFIPGTAQDLRAYFLVLQYWLGGSEENMGNLVRFLVARYLPERLPALDVAKVPPPANYPEVGVYHPALAQRVGIRADLLPSTPGRPRVGLILLRSYLLSGNAAHYDGVIEAMESRGLDVLPVFAAGLDARPAIERFFEKEGRPTVDAVVSLTGFSLVGGPAYNDARAAEEVLARLDLPYIAAHPLEFQTLDQWGGSDRGLMPVESTIMVAIPELDGATAPMVFGGRAGPSGTTCTGCDRRCTFHSKDNAQDMAACPERSAQLAERVKRLVALRRSERAARRVAIVLFNFPPNAGNVGSAAYLAVFESLHNTLTGLRNQGYTVEVPESPDVLRESILCGNAMTYGADANVCALVPAEDHVRREPWLHEIESQWGPAPGRQLSDGRSIFVLGLRLGNVLVAIQPGFGYEGDPMRLLFEKGFAPTHAFSAFYRYLREDFAAHAVLHFGTHGALEFMPGKQVGLSGACWPERMLGALPNVYLYACNNPSEGALAKRRAAATLVSYLTPPLAEAGLYRGLADLKTALDRLQQLPPDEEAARGDLVALIRAEAESLNLIPATAPWPDGDDAVVERLAGLRQSMLELEYTLIPHGLHVAGKTIEPEERADVLAAMAEASCGVRPVRAALAALAAGAPALQAQALSGLPDDAAVRQMFEELERANGHLGRETEIDGLLHALDGGYVRPATGGDLVRTPEVLPTGRNLHGFDPFRLPSRYAITDGTRQAARLIERFERDGACLPESVAMVLWGSDSLKTEGSPIAQAMALMGSVPRFDSYGRVAGAELVPLEVLGRPRIDVVITLSGIFRDLMPLQIKMLAEAAFLAARADEPVEQNFVRKHALAYQAQHGVSLECASLRVFGNAEGAYGANVNHLIEHSTWAEEDELAQTFVQRKGFAYGLNGLPVQRSELLKSVLADVDLTYQNLDSVELGVTTVDNYYDTLGGITGAVKRARRGTAPPVYIGDQTRGAGVVRSLSEQVALETRTRMLNPKWYEGMLKHGYEGVRQIEVHVTNTMGWSATTGQVQPWVYQELAKTFLLDPAMRARLGQLNPTASSRVANRLVEASERSYWKPSAETLDELRRVTDEMEDRLEGVFSEGGD